VNVFVTGGTGYMGCRLISGLVTRGHPVRALTRPASQYKLPPDCTPQLREHLFDRAKERNITVDDLFALKERRRHSPDVPEGHWYKDFGSFKLCGEGEYPKTFLLKGQPAHGQEVE